MPYAVKYISEFDSIKTAITGYKVELLFKDYVGGITRLVAGSTPVLIKCNEDSPNPGIKGQSVTFTYININNSCPMSNFYSSADNTIKMRVSYGNQIIFEGFLVQDDFSEILFDATHEVTISANDNLGLLKDVPFNDAANSVSISINTIQQLKFILSICLQATNLQLQTKVCAEFYTFPQPNTQVTSMSGDAVNNKLILLIPSSYFQIGQVITISGSVSNNGSFTITNIDNTYFAVLTVAQPVTAESNTQNVNVSWSASYYWLDTLINPDTFYKDDATYESTYDVLQKILIRFRLSLFQANGQWNIFGWDQMRYYVSYAIPSRQYDYQFVQIGSGNLDVLLTAGYQEITYPTYGISARPFRPYKFVKETFNYKQPANLLKNANMQTLGALINQYNSGGFIYKEYTFTNWLNSWPGTAATRFIRVVYNSLNQEVDRYIVVTGATSDSARAVQSEPIEVNQGDRITFTFSFRTTQSIPGSSTVQFAVRLYDGSNEKYVDDVYVGQSNWKTGLGYSVTAGSGDNFNELRSVTIESSPAPFSGYLYIYLAQVCSNTSMETHYKDLSFTYTPYVNNVANIIGQTHQCNQSTDTKNKDEKDIYIDSSPSNSIAGTLFKPEHTGFLHTKTNSWRRGHNNLEALRLGEITTFEHLFWRRITRTILDGNLVTLLNNGVHLSLANAIKYTLYPNLIFVWGLLTIDLKRSVATGTLYEFPNSTEADTDLIFSYDFKYLYDTK